MRNAKHNALSFIFFIVFNTVLFQANTVAQNFCASKSTAPWELWVSRVQLGSINNASDKFQDFATFGYSDYTNLSTSVSKGQIYPLSISPALSWIGNLPNAYCRVWIDFNNNKIFEDSEIVLEENNTNPLTANVLIQNTAVTGNVRMRVAVKWGGYPTACETFDRGEVEDYTLQIREDVTTDNSKLKIMTASGSTLADPNTTLSLSISIKNEGTVPSSPDSVFIATWRRVVFNIGSYPHNYALNRVAVPAIAAGATITVNANFSLPATLRTTVVNDFLNIEPYIMLHSKANLVLRGFPLFRDSFEKISYYYPIQPSSATDLVLTGTQISATWDSVNRNIELSLTVRNNGTAAAQNISVNVHRADVNNNITTFNGSAIDSFVQLTGIGQLSRIFTDVSAGREENGLMFNLWKIPRLAAGASVTATFRGKVVGGQGIPQLATIYYRDHDVRPYILYADVRDANRANDSIAPYTYRFVPITSGNQPDLTLSNLTIPTPSVSQGGLLNYTFDAKNIGTGNASGSFSIKAYISRDNILSIDDIQDGIIPTGNYAAGLTIPQIGGASTISTSIAAGQYYLILKIDADNQVLESNENNNVIASASTFTVSSIPNNSCRFQDSLQLISLYNATNGANWLNKWNLNTPINTWHGVNLDVNGCVSNISMENNNLVGTLPNLNMPNLLLFNLRGNPLSGTIPNFNFPKLTALYLTNSQLTGTIPNFNFPNLEVLMLYSNRLTGAIPSLNYPFLFALHLDNNQLTGTIPNFNYNFLNEIYLGNNQFTGSIPIINCPVLKILALDGNRLIGNIPSFNMLLIRELYLNSNQLSGCIPSSLKSYCGRTVDISNNPNLATQSFGDFCSNNTGACSSGNPDMALSITATPSVYRQWTINNFRISVQNTDNQTFTNVNIEFPFPTKTVSGGVATSSIGTWREWCAGNIHCFTWDIPSLAANMTATLEIPLFILGATGNITATTRLLSSTPTDGNTANNTASVTLTLNPQNVANQSLVAFKPTQTIPIVIQKIAPTVTEGDIVVDIESFVEKKVTFYFYNLAGKLTRTESRKVEKGDNRLYFDFTQDVQGVYLIKTDVGTGRGVPLKFVKM